MKKQVLRWLRRGKSITGMDALKLFGCFRLASRIHEIRCDGINIKKRSLRVRTRNGYVTVAEYYL